MKKLILVLSLISMMGCGTVGYQITKRTGDEKFRGEAYWNVIELDLNNIWFKKVDSNGNEIQTKWRWQYCQYRLDIRSACQHPAGCLWHQQSGACSTDQTTGRRTGQSGNSGKCNCPRPGGYGNGQKSPRT